MDGDRVRLAHRQAELAVIDGWLAALRAGGCRGLVVSGPAGSGRSALLGLIADRVAGAALVLRAQGSAGERDLPWGVFGQLLRSVESVGGEGTALRLPALGGPDHRAALDGWVELLGRAAERQPVLLLVDDADDADPESVRALAYLVRRWGSVPIGWVVAVRDDGAEADLPELSAAGPSLRLVPEPLCTGCMTAVAEAVWGAPLDDELADVITLAADGNPGVVTALTRGLAAAGIDPGAPDPEQVIAVAARVFAGTRMAWLAARHPQAADLLTALAVMGTADPALPALVLGLGELAAARARQVLHRAGLITPGGSGTFDRPLLRTIVLAGIDTERRSALHLAAAELLARLGSRIEDVAEHLMSVEPIGLGWAVESLQQAARTAAERGDYDTASRYLQRAVVESGALPSRLPSAPLVGQLGAVEARRDLPAALRHIERVATVETDPGRRAQLLLPVLEPALLADSFGAAATVLTCADSPGEGESALLEARAAWCGEPGPLRRRWRSALRLRPGPDRSAASRGAAAVLLAGASRSMTVVRRHAEAGLGAQAPDRLPALLALVWAEELPAAITAATGLIDQARTDHSPAGLAAALVLRAEAARRSGSLPAALADAQAALDQALAIRARGLGNAAAAVLVLALSDAGQHDLARQALTRIDPLARPHPLIAGLVRHTAGVQALRRTPDRALGYFLEAGRTLAGVGLDNPACLGWQFGAVAAQLATGQRAAAEDLAARTLAAARRWGTPGLVGQALAAAASCRPDGGLRLLHAAAEQLADSPLRGELRRVLAATVALAQAGGDDRAAVRAADQVAALADPDDRLAADERSWQLTASESRVTDLVMQGMSNQEVADMLCLSRRTVDTHLGRIYRKLGIRSRADLARALGHDRG